MPGAARDSAYYLFPILAHLPYVRPIKIGRKDNTVATAVELLDQELITQILSDDESPSDQGEMEWA